MEEFLRLTIEAQEALPETMAPETGGITLQEIVTVIRWIVVIFGLDLTSTSALNAARRILGNISRGETPPLLP